MISGLSPVREFAASRFAELVLGLSSERDEVDQGAPQNIDHLRSSPDAWLWPPDIRRRGSGAQPHTSWQAREKSAISRINTVLIPEL